MPAPTDQPNLRLLENVPPNERGAVVPAHAISDPDRMVELGACAWTAEPVTVHTTPPVTAATVTAKAGESPLTTGQQGEEGEGRPTADDMAAAVKEINKRGEQVQKLGIDNEKLAKRVKDMDAELVTVRQQAEQVGDAKLKLEDENGELRKALEKANADHAAGNTAAKELADLRAAVAKAKSLKEAQEAAK